MSDCTCCASVEQASDDLVPGQLTPEMEALRAAGFELLHETGLPVPVSDLAAKSGWPESLTLEVLDALEGLGRARRNEDGQLVGIAGLSVEPTPHVIHLDGRQLWTWCALDAVGIFPALGATGTVTSTSPDGNGDLEIEFDAGSTESPYALSLADGYENGNVYESWCRQVNFFRDTDAATEFAKSAGLQGEPATIAEISDMAGSVWAPVVSGLTSRGA